jgi:hypothetical protein
MVGFLHRRVRHLHGKPRQERLQPQMTTPLSNHCGRILLLRKGLLHQQIQNRIGNTGLQKTQWGKLREKLKGLYRESNRSKGKPTETEDVSSTTQDREALATACIWIGSPEFAEFWHLQNTTYHCSGRGSEVSLIKSEDITTIEKNELVYRYVLQNNPPLRIELRRQ